MFLNLILVLILVKVLGHNLMHDNLLHLHHLNLNY
jgi:hypothetical protein